LVIRILIAHTQPIVREGLRAMLAGVDGILVVGDACDGQEAIRKCDVQRPDMILLDLRLSDRGGLEVLQMLRATAPRARIVTFSTEPADADALRALHAGAAGYFGKDTQRNELVACVLRVHAGHLGLSPSLGAALLQASQRDGMTPREREIVDLLRGAHSNRQIARQLGIAESTVKSHVRGILKKLGAKSRAQVVLLAGRLDLHANRGRGV
jgi:DNA-binding NarL/FixJ family response regulator